MKKIIVSILACILTSSIYAQKAIEEIKFTDNWSIGVNVGVTSSLTHSVFFKNMCTTWEIGLGKQVTLVFGLGIEAMTSINTTVSKIALDNTNLSLLTTINLNNFFRGYLGISRLFEAETVAGIGWLHYFMNEDGNLNSMSSKLGLNFNLGEEKVWTFSIKSAFV